MAPPGFFAVDYAAKELLGRPECVVLAKVDNMVFGAIDIHRIGGYSVACLSRLLLHQFDPPVFCPSILGFVGGHRRKQATAMRFQPGSGNAVDTDQFLDHRLSPLLVPFLDDQGIADLDGIALHAPDPVAGILPVIRAGMPDKSVLWCTPGR